MKGKLDKNTNCEYCGKPLEAKYRSKRFCDNKCRVYFKRENGKESPGIKLGKNRTEKTGLPYPAFEKKEVKPVEVKSVVSTPDFYPGRNPGESLIDYRLRIIEENSKKS